MIRDPVRRQISVQPEAIAPRLITTDHRGPRGQREPSLRADNLVRQDINCAGRNLADPWTLAHPHRKSQLPRPLAQFECQQQRRCRRSRLADTGLRDHRYAPP
jgi:hypothetical protein